MSTTAPNKHPRTSINGWTQQRTSPVWRRKRDGKSPSHSPAPESGRRAVVARRSHHASVMDTSSVVNVASTSSVASSSAMMIDGSSSDTDIRRRMAMELQAREQQKLLAMEETRARAAALADASSRLPSTSIVTPPRQRMENTYKEAEYDAEITQYMVDMDNETLANAESMDSQPEVQWYMRPFLVDFLIEVHAQFRLRPEVLYLAMNIVDRYVSKRVVYKKHYQLVGCAALWIAAKFEDAKDKVPLTKELSEMCCKAYDESAFIQMEGHVLGTIGWTLGAPTAEAWLRLYCMDDQEDKRTANVARFVMEVSLFHREHVGVPGYDIAAGALSLARYICGKPKRRDFGMARPAMFGPESAERAVRVAYQIDGKLSSYSETVSEVLRRKYTPSYYHAAAVVVREWYSKPGNRFTNLAEPSFSGRPFNFATPSLSMTSAWRRGSWMSSSPTATHSCSSSENGDDGPLTPITPNNPHHAQVDPFSSHAIVVAAQSKENVAPTPTRVKSGPMPGSIRPIIPNITSAGKVADVNMLYPQRPALHALPPAGDMGLAHRGIQVPRRLSN